MVLKELILNRFYFEQFLLWEQYGGLERTDFFLLTVSTLGSRW